MRPRQWIKNAIVPAALLFALGDQEQTIDGPAVLRAAAAFCLFCLASSAVYLLNDVKDRDLDRLHPTKRLRPIAAGRLSIRTALMGAGFAAVLSVGLGGLLTPRFGLIVALYLIMQVAYTHGVKRIPVADVLTIAAGFILRAYGGAVAIQVTISHWLLLCTGLLALFLGFCKRRHEKVVLKDLKDQARPVLQHYTEAGLDQLIALVGGATLTAYLLYTLSPDTLEKFGNHRLVATIPFVALGLWRYYRLVYQHEKGGRPEQVLLTDIPLLSIVACFGATALWAFLW